MTHQIIDKWHHYMVTRQNITASTVRTINTRTARLKELIGDNPKFDEQTLNRITVQGKHKYSYRHRIAKMYVWICRWANDNGMIDRNYLAQVKMKRPTFEHTKISLSKKELTSIRELQLVGHIARIRDIFVLQCLTGWSFADLTHIDKATVYDSCGRTWIKICRKKGGKPCPVPCDDDLMAILKRYNWQPEIPCNQIYNRDLKRIASLAKIKKRITSHTARKTFAQHWLDRGASPFMVAQMLGNSEKVLLMHYGGLTERTLDTGLKAIGL